MSALPNEIPEDSEQEIRNNSRDFTTDGATTLVSAASVPPSTDGATTSAAAPVPDDGRAHLMLHGLGNSNKHVKIAMSTHFAKVLVAFGQMGARLRLRESGFVIHARATPATINMQSGWDARLAINVVDAATVTHEDEEDAVGNPDPVVPDAGEGGGMVMQLSVGAVSRVDDAVDLSHAASFYTSEHHTPEHPVSGSGSGSGLARENKNVGAQVAPTPSSQNAPAEKKDDGSCCVVQ